MSNIQIERVSSPTVTVQTQDSKSFVVNDLRVCMNISENTLIITVSNLVMLDEFSLTIENDSEIFLQHVIKDINILHQILVDKLSGDKSNSSDNAEVLLLNSHDDHCFYINIKLRIPYISDDHMSLKLPRIEKVITPQQLMENVEYRLNKSEQKVEEYKTKLSSIGEELVSLRTEMSELIAGQPVITGLFNEIKKNFWGVERKRCLSSEAYSTVISINISYNGSQYYINDNYRIVSFATNKFKYFTNLAVIKFRNCPFTDLSFLPVTCCLKSIILVDCMYLTTIAHLSSFKNLEYVTIEGNCRITDLETLLKCPSLRQIKLPSGWSLPEAMRLMVLPSSKIKIVRSEPLFL